MKKIMFNDKYGLTQAVIEGRKTMTRRFLTGRYDDVFCNEDDDWFGEITRMVKLPYPDCKAWRKDRVLLLPKYKVGEIVAIAQAYKDIADTHFFEEQCAANEESVAGMKYEKGWDNKMFVKAAYMPLHIRITDLKVERLQDISDEDCMKEGVFFFNCGIDYGFTVHGMREKYGTAREAFGALIDKVSGKGTWDSNPYVVAYTFELID